MADKKIILFGGTFDPIHFGHLAVCSYASKYIGAEKTFFIPAKLSPLKQISPGAGSQDRLKMISLAISENNKFQATAEV